MSKEKVLENVRNYVELLQNEVPPILANWEEYFPFSPLSEKGLGVLLIYSSLLQDVQEVALASWVRQWYLSLGENLFRAQTVPYEELRCQVSSVPGFQNWSLESKVVGILRSVGDFIQQVLYQQSLGGLGIWIGASCNSEEGLRKLSESIFYMGKGSDLKPKSRYFFWLYHWIVHREEHLDSVKEENGVLFPVTAGGRFLIRIYKKKYPGVFGKHGSDVEFGSVEELQNYNQIIKMIVPDAPWSVQYPLSLYKRRLTTTKYKCQEKVGSCDLCPLNGVCNPI